MAYRVTLAAVEAAETRRAGVEYERLGIGDALAQEVRMGDKSAAETYRAVSQELAAAGHISGYSPSDLRDYRITAEEIDEEDRARFFKAGIALETLIAAARTEGRLKLMQDMLTAAEGQNRRDATAVVLDADIVEQVESRDRLTAEVQRYMRGRRGWTVSVRAFRAAAGLASKDGPAPLPPTPRQVAEILQSTPNLIRNPDVRRALRAAENVAHQEAIAAAEAAARRQRQRSSQEDQETRQRHAREAANIAAHSQFRHHVDGARRSALAAVDSWNRVAAPPPDEREEDLEALARLHDAVRALSELVAGPSFEEQLADLLGGNR